MQTDDRIAWASSLLENGEGILGIELGSTRIKAVLMGPDNIPLASGAHGWENSFQDGVWTYPLEEVWEGLQSCYADLQRDVSERYGVTLRRLQAFGVSGMMHGYLPLDAKGEPLVSFRTWRNTMTARAAEELTELFQYPIPQRWSIAHLYQAMLNNEGHVDRIAQLTTLAGYVHWKLTGEKVMGIGEASGMFPIDLGEQDFNSAKLEDFDALCKGRGLGWKLRDLLPRVLGAGAPAGALTEEGARLLDPEGNLEAGIPLCPPEGDAGTGMVATNSVRVRTGNVSAGTSVFAMLVLEGELSKLQPEIDLVTTPDGQLVGMAHAANCSSDLNAWMRLFGEACAALGHAATEEDLFGCLLPLALEGDPDAGGLLAYGYVSGEHLTGCDEGRPLFARSQDSQFTLANFIRSHLFAALGALRVGLDILVRDEGVAVDEIRGHGGFFKTPGVGERIMAAATNIPVSTLETAGEGGAWGIALLASFTLRENREQTLPEFLDAVFSDAMSEPIQPDPADVEGFEQFFQRYQRGLSIERAAIKHLN